VVQHKIVPGTNSLRLLKPLEPDLLDLMSGGG